MWTRTTRRQYSRTSLRNASDLTAAEWALLESLLDARILRDLLGRASYAFRIGAGEGIAALLIALDQEAAYDNANFTWSSAQYPTFIDVGRVVTAARARGRGQR